MTDLRFVLVRPEYPSNIGASARALKTMGFRDLWLVKPRRFPHPEAVRLATEAADVLAEATVVDDLDAALEDCTLSIATSGRPRSADWPAWTADEAALAAAAVPGRVALVFGPEPSGLTSEEIYRCRYQSWIPTGPDCRSLNLAQAVQVYAYVMGRALAGPEAEPSTEASPAEPPAPAVGDGGAFEPCTDGMLAHLYRHLSAAIGASGFARYDPEHLLLRFRRVFNRAGLSVREASMLTGFFATLARRLSAPGNQSPQADSKPASPSASNRPDRS